MLARTNTSWCVASVYQGVDSRVHTDTQGLKSNFFLQECTVNIVQQSFAPSDLPLSAGIHLYMFVRASERACARVCVYVCDMQVTELRRMGRIGMELIETGG